MSLIECTTLFGEKKMIPAERVSFRPSVYGIIVQADQVLFVNMRSTGKLFLPGGGVEVNERLEEALQREVREETGLEVEIGRFVGFKEEFFYYDPTDFAFHGLMFFYLCSPRTYELASKEQIDDGEAETPRWVPIDQLRPEEIQSHSDIVLQGLRLMTS